MLTIIISFFKKKIKRRINIDDKAFNMEKCRYCNEIQFKDKLRHIHHFVRHYESEKEEPFHDKPLIMWRLGRIQFYKINYEPLKNDFNFFDSDSIIDQYLVNVKRKFTAGNAKMKIKCFFFFVNVHMILVWEVSDIGQPMLKLLNILMLLYILV